MQNVKSVRSSLKSGFHHFVSSGQSQCDSVSVCGGGVCVCVGGGILMHGYIGKYLFCFYACFCYSPLFLVVMHSAARKGYHRRL